MEGLELSGKRALVTGGTKGVGEAIARRLAAGGARVATTAREAPPQGQRGDLFIQTDITHPDGVRKIVERVADVFGGVDILVNNVGGSTAPAGGFALLSDEEWHRALDLNLLSAVRLDRALITGMIERRSGVVIHVSSI